MKAWKKAVSMALSICLAVSLFTGLDMVSAAASEFGTLQNGELADSREGWAVTGEIPVSADGKETAGYWNTSDDSGKYLSVWNNGNEPLKFTISQTVANVEAGSYVARVSVEGNVETAESALTMKVSNDTQKTEVSKALAAGTWNNWVETATDAIETAAGDTVTISISGSLVKGDTGWYGVKGVSFDNVGTIISDAPITVQKVNGLSEDFIHGVDVSTYMSEIQSGAKYYDEDGNEANMFQIFKDGGVNYVRLRVWNCPFRVDGDGKYLYVDDKGTEYNEDAVTTTKDSNGFPVYKLTEDNTVVYREGYGAGNCDIEAAAAMGKIATDYGMKVLIDFHYSDFWADPAKYKAPKAWAGMDLAQKAEALAAYTTDSLNKLKAAGVDVGMVQIGNEINGGMAGEQDMNNICTLLKAGCNAVKAFNEANNTNILRVIHYADPHREGYQVGKAAQLASAEVEYDVFASSFYSFWHGSTENLTNVLKEIATKYNKKVMVAEVSYCTTLEDGDGAYNVVTRETDPLSYSIDAEGQAAAVRDAIAAVSAVGDAGIGTFYWEPAWIPVQNYADAEEEEKADILASNIDKWEKYGSGWASKYSGKAGDDYDPGVDDDESTHGSQWDNQAMFDFNGKALPSVNVYKWVYTGAEGPVGVSTIDTGMCKMDYKATPQLPDKVTVHLNDGNDVENVGVVWDADQVEMLKTADFGEYTIDGSLASFSYDSKGQTITVEAGKYATTCKVVITGQNYLTNGSFEDDSEGTGWSLTNTAGTGNPKVKTDGSAGNAKEGKNYYDAWAAEPMDFSIEQTIEKTDALPSGKYTLYAYYQGTNVASIDENTGIYAEVTYKNGSVKRYSAEIEIPNTWKVFYQAKVPGILINGNVTNIKVGTRVACTGNDSGAWVVVDDINLMKGDSLTEEEENFTNAPMAYTVTFDPNEGTLSEGASATKTVTNGEVYGELPTAVREGYEFTGWYTAKTEGTQITKDSTVDLTGDITLYAGWKEKSETPVTTYTVTFDPNEGTLSEGASATKTVTNGELYGELPTAIREGYEFTGWYTAKTEGTQITKDSTVSLTGDITLYAGWKEESEAPVTTYTVTFDPNEGTLSEGASATKTVTNGELYGELPTAVREGYEFTGWYTAKTEGTQITKDSTVNLAGDITLYAGWKEKTAGTDEVIYHTVTFKDGNTVLDSQKVKEGGAAAAPKAPAKTGYTFTGWDKSFDKVTADLTVNAVFKVNIYTITLNVNGGKKLSSSVKTVTYGGTFGQLPSAKRANYTFSGWFTAKTGGTKVTAATVLKDAENKTIYAQWKKVTKPAKVTNVKAKNSAKKTMKVTFKKVKGADGYEIRYAKKSSMKNAKKVQAASVSKQIKKLTKGATYYVQVRAYKKDSTGKKFYSKSYSKKVKVKIKK